MSAPRMTMPTQLVLRTILAADEDPMSAAEIGREAGLPHGAALPVLAVLERVDWVTSRWDDVADGTRRPPLRRYRLTGDGTREARLALAALPRSTPRRSFGAGPVVEGA